MKTCSIAIFAFASALLAGCWTFNESEYPKATINSIPEGTNVVIGVNGFAATVTEYAEYQEFRTVYVPGFCGRHYVRPGYFETVPTTTYVAQQRTTDRYLVRAKDLFERAGFMIGAATPDWTVDVTFDGPYETQGDETLDFVWPLCTAFFCDYGAATWKAQLRVRDNRTGKLVFHRDYSQRYETNVFCLLPLFSILAADETAPSYMQSWCLSALTDRIVADTSDFFVQADR